MRFKSIWTIFSATICAVCSAPNIKLPNYQFKYTVNDPNTNDHKIQVEKKVGDSLTTAYVVKTIHPGPPNGFQGGNSYIGVSRWSDKTGPAIPILPKDDTFYNPIKIHPFIHKFGIGHKMGLYPDVHKVVKPLPEKIPTPSHGFGWPVGKPNDKDYKSKVEHDHDKDIHSYRPPVPDYNENKPKPILIIVEKRPAVPSKGIYHVPHSLGGTIYKEKSYVGSKTPSISYDLPKSYGWPKRYGLSKFEPDYDPEYEIPIEGKSKSRYDGGYKHLGSRDGGIKGRKNYDDLLGGNKKGLYHTYSYHKRYGTGDHNKDRDDNNDDKEYVFHTGDKGESHDDFDDDHSEYDIPKSISKGSSKSYESSESHSYDGDNKDKSKSYESNEEHDFEKDDENDWYGIGKGHRDDTDDEEEEDKWKSGYKTPSFFKHDEKDTFEHGKWFHDKRKGDKNYEFDHEKDCEKSSH